MSNRLIVLTSGWSGQDWLWTPFMHRCTQNGFDALQLSYGNGGYGRIKASSEALRPLLEAVRKEYDHITFIGHSMGGLVGRYLVQNTDAGRHIDAYVSIATPHNGSPWSWMAPWSASATQMKPNSKMLSKLNALPWPHIPTLNVRASLDFIVPNAKFNHAQEDIVIPRSTHASIILKARTVYEITSWLNFTVFGEGPGYSDGHSSAVKIRTW